MNRKITIINLILLLFCVLFISSCRGHRTEKPPFHPNPNMDWQPKFNAQSLTLPVPENTVPFSDDSTNNDNASRNDILQTDTVKYHGKRNGYWVKRIPMDVNKELLLRGQERYDIYCSVCHTKSGNGAKSMIAKYGWLPSNITAQASINKTDGELFDIITNGIRTMPGYKTKLSAEDRWAIVAYVRALQNIIIKDANTINKVLQKNMDVNRR